MPGLGPHQISIWHCLTSFFSYILSFHRRNQFTDFVWSITWTSCSSWKRSSGVLFSPICRTSPKFDFHLASLSPLWSRLPVTVYSIFSVVMYNTCLVSGLLQQLCGLVCVTGPSLQSWNEVAAIKNEQ